MLAAESLPRCAGMPRRPDQTAAGDLDATSLPPATQVPVTVPTSVRAQCAGRARPGRSVRITGRPGADNPRRDIGGGCRSAAPRSADRRRRIQPVAEQRRPTRDGMWLHL
jgi:hypothetical protein